MFGSLCPFCKCGINISKPFGPINKLLFMQKIYDSFYVPGIRTRWGSYENCFFKYGPSPESFSFILVVFTTQQQIQYLGIGIQQSKFPLEYVEASGMSAASKENRCDRLALLKSAEDILKEHKTGEMDQLDQKNSTLKNGHLLRLSQVDLVKKMFY